MTQFVSTPVEIPFMCSNASQRVVQCSFFSDSQITRPALKMITSQATMIVGPNAVSTTSTWQSSGTSTGPGVYMLVLTQSECSAQGVPGYVTIYTSTATIGVINIPVYFPRVDSYDTMRFGLFALPNAAPAAAGGLPTFGTGTGQLNLSGGSVGLVPGVMSGVSVEVKAGGIQSASVGAGTYSGVSVEVKTGGIQAASVGAGTYSGVSVEVKTGGIQVASMGKGSYSGVSQEILTGGIQVASVGQGSYSGVTFGIDNIKAGAYSGVTVNADNLGRRLYSDLTVRIEGVDYSGLTIKGITNYANISNVTLAAGTHSNVTIQGVTRLNSNVTLNADTHSGATIQGVTRLNSGVTLNAAVHSGASVEIKTGGIQSSSFGAGAVDAVALSTDAGQEIADRLLARNIEGGSDGGRIVQDGFSLLRNRVEIDGSTVTVYRADDSTSAWTGTVSTGTFPISGVNPVGP